jgi:hypothetical protein
MYEQRGERLLPFGAFLWRLAVHAGVSLAVVSVSLLAGILGYVHYERALYSGMVFLVVVGIALSATSSAESRIPTSTRIPTSSWRGRTGARL